MGEAGLMSRGGGAHEFGRLLGLIDERRAHRVGERAADGHAARRRVEQAALQRVQRAKVGRLAVPGEGEGEGED